MTAMAAEDLESTDVARLVRRAAEGDLHAWERLVDQYARLIWSITGEFKLVESDAADVAQTTWLRLLEHIDRIEYPARVGSWLAATARHECLRSLAAHKKVVLSQDDIELAAVDVYEPPVDERLLAAESAQVVREALSRLPRPVAAAARDAHGRSADGLRRYLRRARAAGRQHRSHPRAVPGPAARPTPGGVSPVPRHRPTGRLQPRPPGNAVAYLGQQVGHEQQHRVRAARGQFGRAGHRDVRSRHPQALLGGRDVDHDRQQRAIHVRLAQQRHGPGRGTVTDYPAAGGPLRCQPVMQVLSMSVHIPLETGEGVGIATRRRERRRPAATGPPRRARACPRRPAAPPAGRSRRRGRTARRYAG